MSVPAPLLVSGPLPLITPPNVNVPADVLKPPPPALTVTPRAELTVPEVCSVPPPNVSPPVTSPRLLSLVIASAPALIVVPPE